MDFTLPHWSVRCLQWQLTDVTHVLTQGHRVPEQQSERPSGTSVWLPHPPCALVLLPPAPSPGRPPAGPSASPSPTHLVIRCCCRQLLLLAGSQLEQLRLIQIHALEELVAHSFLATTPEGRGRAGMSKGGMEGGAPVAKGGMEGGAPSAKLPYWQRPTPEEERGGRCKHDRRCGQQVEDQNRCSRQETSASSLQQVKWLHTLLSGRS